MRQPSLETSLLPLRVITPHSGLDAFRHALVSLVAGFGPALRLGWRFFLRDTRADYRQSLLGYLWLFLPPLGNTLVWVFLNDQDVVQIDSGAVPYALFVMTGTILWTAFNASVMSMLGVINSARGILAKVNFSHESLIYAALMKAGSDTLVSSLLLIPALLIYRTELHPAMLLFPLALAGSLLVGAALGLILLPLSALYTDVSRGIQLVLRFGFFFTPVIFSLPARGFARQIMMLNPATPIIVSGRDWLTRSGEAMPIAFVAVVSGSIGLIMLGLLFYKISVPHLIERLGG